MPWVSCSWEKREAAEGSLAQHMYIFRKDDHPNFKPCGDQILRNFLNGLVIYKRGPKPR